MSFIPRWLSPLASGAMALSALLVVQTLAQATHPSSGAAASCSKPVKATGTIKFSDWQFPATLNGFTTSSSVISYVLNAMFDSYFVYDAQARLVPQLTAVVPSVKNGGIRDGGRTVIMRLKKKQYWSNGMEITSADVKFGQAVGSTAISGPACAGSCDVIARIDTPDKYTAVIHLKHPYAPFLAYGTPPLLPHRWHSAAGSWTNPKGAAQLVYQTPSFNWESSAFPTNGPYQAAQFVRDDRIVLRPMKYYRNWSCGARVKQLIFVAYSNKPALIAAAANGATDVTGGGGGYTIADLPALRQHTGAYRIDQVASFQQEHMEFNLDPTYNGKPNPLANLKVRLALALALDKMGLLKNALAINTATARQIIAWSPWVISPGLVQPFADTGIKGQWDPIARKYQPNTGSGQALSDARKLLAQTPYKDGFDLDFVTTSGNPVRSAQVSIFQASWRRLNVNVKPNLVPSSVLFSDWAQGSNLNHGAFQAVMFAFFGSPDPDAEKYNMQSRYIDRTAGVHSTLNANYSGIRDKAIDQGFTRAAQTLNPKLRQKSYAVIQEHLNQRAYWIPLYYRPDITTHSSRVRGFQINPTQAGPTWNIARWSLAK